MGRLEKLEERLEALEKLAEILREKELLPPTCSFCGACNNTVRVREDGGCGGWCVCDECEADT